MRAALAILATALLALGCAGGRGGYSGPEGEASGLALLRGSAQAQVYAIDGLRTRGTEWALAPGPHELWLQMRLRSSEFNVNWDLWAYCRAELLAAAGARYETRVRTRKEPSSALASRVQVELAIVDADGAVRARAGSCRSERPDLAGGDGP